MNIRYCSSTSSRTGGKAQKHEPTVKTFFFSSSVEEAHGDAHVCTTAVSREEPGSFRIGLDLELKPQILKKKIMLVNVAGLEKLVGVRAKSHIGSCRVLSHGLSLLALHERHMSPSLPHPPWPYAIIHREPQLPSSALARTCPFLGGPSRQRKTGSKICRERP